MQTTSYAGSPCLLLLLLCSSLRAFLPNFVRSQLKCSRVSTTANSGTSEFGSMFSMESVSWYQLILCVFEHINRFHRLILQILNDALKHGFMHMERIALLIFDEGMPETSHCSTIAQDQAQHTMLLRIIPPIK